ncbi:MAG: acetylxylan esterase [Isosphaeraceae bacterium]|jgi:hypothetical protein|nr:MAG: acetylxylan esterase [Isosphaeraceae bacterium]
MNDRQKSTRREFMSGAVGLTLTGAMMKAGKAAQDSPEVNYDEAKVPPYTLPDPLVMKDGSRVATAADWRQRRRPELLRLFSEHVYGRTPEAQIRQRVEQVERSEQALEGQAERAQYRVVLGEEPRAVEAHLLVYLPQRRTGPAPVFLGLNFPGNHGVTHEPEVLINPGWFADQPRGLHPGNRASEKNRGEQASRWSLAMAVERGYGVATAYYGDFDPDYDDGFRNGVHPLLDPPGTDDPNRPADAWGSIGAWAWGLSRLYDALEGIEGVDRDRVIVMGHSRLGKAALWAGAQDERFALVISNESGCGGAALSKRIYGETVGRINRTFPHWFCDQFATYNENEVALPVDQHELLALIAPRPVLVCSAEEDRWADPRGEFLACVGADPVYRLLGTDGLETKEMPAVNQPVLSTIGYHIRPGEHDVKPRDWEVYLDFADRHLKPAGT